MIRCRNIDRRTVWVLLLVGSILGLLAGVGCGSSSEDAAPALTPSPAASATESLPTPTPSPTVANQNQTVKVQGLGFAKAGKEVGYGAVLVNDSPSEDALHLRITVKLLDAEGSVLKTDRPDLTGIPAGEKFYLGGWTVIPKSAKPTKLTVVVHVRSWEDVGLTLPKVSRVHALHVEFMEPDITIIGGDGTGLTGMNGAGFTVKDVKRQGTAVRGRVTNTRDGALSSRARICVVLFDTSGNVVGGGGSHMWGGLGRGRKAKFEVPYGTVATPLDEVYRAAASIENRID